MFTSVKNRGLVKHFVCVLVLLALSLVLFLPSFGAAVDGRVPMFEESLPSIGVVQAYSSYLGQYGVVPQLFNTKCYSEPMDSFVYMRTPVGLLPGLLSSVFGLDAFLALVVEFVFFTFVSLLVLYYLVFKYVGSFIAAFLGGVLYTFASGSFLIMSQAFESRMFQVPFLVSVTFLFVELVFSSRKFWFVFLGLGPVVWLWFLGTNEAIAVVAVVSAVIMWFAVHMSKKNALKALLTILVFAITIWFFLGVTSTYSSYYPQAVMDQYHYLWQQSPTVLNVFGMNSRIIGEVMNQNIAAGISLVSAFAFLPAVLSVLAIFYSRKFVVPFFFGVLLAFCVAGVYGPFQLIFVHLPAIVRDTGRFVPVVGFVFSFLGAVGFAYVLEYGKSRFSLLKWNILRVASGCLIGVIVFSGLLCVFSQPNFVSVPSEVESAYKVIPEGSRVLALPIWGTNELSLSSSNVEKYVETASVGNWALHLNTYLVNKYGLKSAHDPMSEWERPFMTGWFFDLVNERIVNNDVVGAVRLLDFAPDLQYLIVYNSLMPRGFLQQLSRSDVLTKFYSNSLMTVFEKSNSVGVPVVESEKAFLLFSGSYADSLLSLDALSGAAIPVLNGNTPWGNIGLEDVDGMSNLVFTLEDTSLREIAVEYAVAATENKFFVDLNRDGGFYSSYWSSAAYWQPALSKYSLTTVWPAPLNVDFNVGRGGVYDVFVRVASDRLENGSLRVALDGEVIGNVSSVQDSFGLSWIDVRTVDVGVGKHTLTFVNVNPAYSSTIDAVAVVDADEFAAVLAERIGLLKALILEKDYLGVYEAETSYTELVRGVVTNDWGRNWSAYPSGGRSIRFSATQSSATILIEAPVDGDYFVTVRVNGLSQFSFLDLSVGSENMSFVESFGLGGWTYLAYRVHLAEGIYNLTSSWLAQNTVWLDAVYVSSRMIPELVESRGARVLFRNIDDSMYSVVSFADQPCYLLLANSYFPLWKVSTSSGVKQPYLSNAFLMGFYVEGSNYTIRFG